MSIISILCEFVNNHFWLLIRVDKYLHTAKRIVGINSQAGKHIYTTKYGYYKPDLFVNGK